MDFRPFCPFDLDLDPMTFMYELDPYPMKIYRMNKNKLRTSRLSKTLSCCILTYKHTTLKLYSTPPRGWSGN